MMAWNQGHKNTAKMYFSDNLMWLRRRCSFTLSNKYQSKLGWNTFFSSRQTEGMLWLRQAPCIIMTHYFSCLPKRMGKYIGYSKSFTERILTITLLRELFKCRSKRKKKSLITLLIYQVQRFSLHSLHDARENNI